jgi:single-strand DNA-binding protein
MISSMRNSVQLIGNLGFDPEVKDTKHGKKYAKLVLATNESYKDANGRQIDETQWHDLVAWGPRAEFAGRTLTKGRQVAVEGKLVHRQYDDKDGNKRYFTEVVVNQLMPLGPGQKSEG